MAQEASSTSALTAAELGAEGAQNDSRDGYRDAVRREQRDLDARLREALENVDRKLGTRPTERPQLLRTRQRLAADQRLVEKSDERGWDELKAEVERDASEAE